AWILSTGLNSGVSKLVGDGISQYRLLAKYPKDVIAIGLTQWGSLTKDTRNLLKQQSKMDVGNKLMNLHDSETLEWNHTHFILFDNGQLKSYMSDSQRSQLVEAAVNDRSEIDCSSTVQQLMFLNLGYPVTIIVEGGKNTLEVVLHDISKRRPVVIIQTDYMSLNTIFDSDKAPTSFIQLNNAYSAWIGSFIHEIYVVEKKGSIQRFGSDTLYCCSKVWRNLCNCCPCVKRRDDPSHYAELGEELTNLERRQSYPSDIKSEWNNFKEIYKEEEMLRDLFLWALFTTEIELAKVILFHLKPRICAALIATRIYRHFSKEAINAFTKEKLREQAMEFEQYASDCVEKCYAHNEKLTCELIIREVPLFGNVTCMQVAVAGECAKFFATPCVDELLNQICYMMLYKFDAPRDTGGRFHWTEIYVIVTISAMLCEELRQLAYHYQNRMQERWYQSTSWLLSTFSKLFYLSLYALFYLGILLRYRYGDTLRLLTVARILMAFDLELWYIQSLKFIIVLEYLGPKLFMIKNMLRDLAAFVYIIFILIAAYGVVSRSMISYQNVTFDGRGIFSNILYPPYWFIYGNTQDELQKLDSMYAKMIAKHKKSNSDWNEFENAATFTYARSVVEKTKQNEADAFQEPILKKNETGEADKTTVAAKEDLRNIHLELQKLSTNIGTTDVGNHASSSQNQTTNSP
ncbi:unnamed protein product, partial [Didymodactylos carnosus]